MNSKAPFHHNAGKQTKSFAKELRKRHTPAEELFWQMVRNRKMQNLKIRRQHPIGKYIADFYCHELLLVIEIDGGIHNVKEVKQKDKIREAFIKELGLHVMRFSNDDVFVNAHIIEEQIKTFKLYFKQKA